MQASTRPLCKFYVNFLGKCYPKIGGTAEGKLPGLGGAGGVTGRSGEEVPAKGRQQCFLVFLLTDCGQNLMIHSRLGGTCGRIAEPILAGSSMRGRSFLRRGKLLDAASPLKYPGETSRRIVSYSCTKGRNYPVCKEAVFPSPEPGPVMAHEIAKLLLEKAGTFLERTQAIEAALQLGMPLNEIQEYLDWLDAMRGPLPPKSDGAGEAGDRPPA